MTSAKDCRQLGAECLQWAKAAGGDKDRLSFLQMANSWLYAAANLEGRLTRPSNQNSPIPPPLLVRMKRLSV